MTGPLVRVSLLIPVLLELAACCGKDVTSTTTSLESFDLVVSEEELAAAVDAEGTLTAEGCEALCRPAAEEQFETVSSVDGCVPASSPVDTGAGSPTTTGGTGSTGTTGDTGASGPAVTCMVSVESVSQCIGGRDHACIDRVHRGHGGSRFGAWLGAQAHAEATSVKSFVSIGSELRRFGAPEELVRAAASAARDEVAHARMLRKLANARGGASVRLRFQPVPERSLLAFAIENAVEGCVHETWSAVVAAFQSLRAASPDVRAAYVRIAADEARHGDLAWAIDAWVAGLLTADERATVAAARRAAVEALLAAVDVDDAELRAEAGLPDAVQARRLLTGLDRAVWRPEHAA